MINNNKKTNFSTKPYKNEAFIDFNMSQIYLSGDFLIEFYNVSMMNKKV